LQTLSRRDNIAELTAGYGLTAALYRRDKLDDLIGMQVGTVRHTITAPRQAADSLHMLPGSAPGGRPGPVLHLHPTPNRYAGDASPSAPGGMTVIYKDLIASDQRTYQVIADVAAALASVLAMLACASPGIFLLRSIETPGAVNGSTALASSSAAPSAPSPAKDPG
jgi:hypothetical protein